MIPNEFLAQVEILKDLDGDQLSSVRDCCSEQTVENGTRLFKDGDPAARIYLVREGAVDLRFDLPGRATSFDSTISTVTETMAFGWSGLVPPNRYRLSAYCASRSCRIVEIDVEGLTRLFEQDPVIGYRVMTNVCEMVGKRFQQLRSASAEMRAAKTKVTVHMATCGIAAGARGVMEALMKAAADSGRPDIETAAGGCLGKCPNEPLVTVEIEGENPVVYRKMTPEKMQRVFHEHVLGGHIQQDLVMIDA